MISDVIQILSGNSEKEEEEDKKDSKALENTEFSRGRESPRTQSI